MRMILVDDEYLALSRLNKLLLERNDCEVIGSYLKAEEAMDQIERHQPEVVFMDIHMPGMNGIQATERIHKISPATEVIFTTAYNEHALTAYGLEVLDYIMKPITRDRLEKTMRMFQRRIMPARQNTVATSMMIRCMGALQVQPNSEESPQYLKFRTSKIRELFAYLLHHRNNLVNRDLLLELLWPGLDEHKGISNLHTSIYRLRGMMNEVLGENRFSISYYHHGYTLEIREIRIDAEEWETHLLRLPPLSSGNIAEHRRVLDMYGGKYLGEDDYIWAEVERQRLQALWRKHALQLAKYYVEQGMDVEALTVYHRIQQFEPLLEDISLSLMKIYDRMGDVSSVVTQYNQLVVALRQEVGVSPGLEVDSWYQQWKKANI